MELCNPLFFFFFFLIFGWWRRCWAPPTLARFPPAPVPGDVPGGGPGFAEPQERPAKPTPERCWTGECLRAQGEGDAVPGPGVWAEVGKMGAGACASREGGGDTGAAGYRTGARRKSRAACTSPAPARGPGGAAPMECRGCGCAAAGCRWGEGTASVPARGCVCPRARQPLWGSGAAVPACPRCVCARVLGALFV